MQAYRVDQVWQLADVYEIRRNTKINGQLVPKQGEFDEQIDQKYNYILIVDDDKPVGTARVNLSNTDYGKIERVSVIESYQGKGVGRQLINEAEAWIKDTGYNHVVITSLPSAQKFYEKQGYIKTKTYERVDFNLAYMEKDL